MKNNPGKIIKLGPRLEKIASFVPSGTKLADIGTDHAYLPVYLVQKGIIPKAVGVEVHSGPFLAAKETVSLYGLEEKIDIRLGNGLSPLGTGEADLLVIAGMGGAAILNILQSSPEKLRTVTRLILQPQGSGEKVRKELLAHGWGLCEDFFVEEEEKLYSILCFSRTEGMNQREIESRVEDIVNTLLLRINKNDPADPPDADKLKGNKADLEGLVWQYGFFPVIRREKLLVKLIDQQIAAHKKIIKEMSLSEREEVRLKSGQYKQKIKMIEEIKTWLFQ